MVKTPSDRYRRPSACTARQTAAQILDHPSDPLPDQRGAQDSTGRGDLLHSTIQGLLNRWLKDYKVRGTDQELPEYFTKLARVLGSRYLVLTTSLGHPEPLQGRPEKLANVYPNMRVEK